MKACDACKLDTETPCGKGGCVCPAVDEFFKEPEFSALMDALATKDNAQYDEAEAAKAPGAVRCTCCFFYLCRCAAGLSGRLKKL